jgi:hypothetical protein
MVRETVTRRSDADQIAALLDSPEIGQLVTELVATHWTGRPGYPIRTMVGMALVKSLYTLPTWTHRRADRRARRPARRARLPQPVAGAKRPRLLPVHRQAPGVQATA